LKQGTSEDWRIVQFVPDKESNTGLRVIGFRPRSLAEAKQIDDLIMQGNNSVNFGLMDIHALQTMEKYNGQKFKFKEHSLGDIVRRYTIMPLKSISLATINFAFNNILDINLKNIIMQEGGIFSPESVLGDTISAAKWYHLHNKYERLASDIVDWNKKDWYVQYSTYIKTVHPEQYTQRFIEDMEIVAFMENAIMTPAMSSESATLLARMRANVIGEGKKSSQLNKIFNKIFYGGRFSPFRYNVEINSVMELVGRTGLHINDIRKGLSPDESLLKILKTHFNYSNKTKAEMYGEFVIPFLSYPLRSMEFWGGMGTGLTKDNRAMKMIADVLMLSWGRDTLNDNEYAQYQASRGNIPVGNYVMQTGLTFMDALGALYFDKDKPMPERLLPQQVIRKTQPLLKNIMGAAFRPDAMPSEERIFRNPGLSQGRNIYRAFASDQKSLDVIMPSIADKYYQSSKNVMRSSFAYRNYMYSKPYSYYNGRIQFKNQIQPNAMRQLRWRWTEIRNNYISR
jgi:hypothetical protein